MVCNYANFLMQIIAMNKFINQVMTSIERSTAEIDYPGLAQQIANSMMENKITSLKKMEYYILKERYIKVAKLHEEKT
jgi:hypothetical protein